MAERILMNAAGSPGGPAVIELAHRRGFEVVACDINPGCPAAILADAFFIDAPLAEPGYARSLFVAAHEHEAKWILPNSGAGLLAQAAAEQVLDGFEVLVPDTVSASLCEDKAALFSHLGPDLAPHFHTPATLDELDALVNGTAPGSICAKPRTAEGSRGFYRLVDELDADEIMNSRSRSRIPATEFRRRLEQAGAQTLLDKLVFSEFLPGRELTVVCCAHPGGTVEMLPFERLAPGPDGVSTLNRLVDDRAAQETIQAVLKRLPGLRYYLDIQIMEDAKGRWKVVDLNPRISGLISCCPPLDDGRARPGDFPLLLPRAPKAGSVVKLFYSAMQMAQGHGDTGAKDSGSS